MKIFLNIRLIYFVFLLCFCLLLFGGSVVSCGSSSKEKEQVVQDQFIYGLEDEDKDKNYSVYLLTMERGYGLNMIWTWWGHSALLIRDNKKGRDLVFDYGAFRGLDFNFFYKYLNGFPAYFLSIDRLDKVLNRYARQDRTVYAQPLYADQEVLANLYQELLIASSPSNREYFYHHVYNNCSTKLRDIIDETFFNYAMSKDYKQRKIAEGQNPRAKAMAVAWSQPLIFLLFNAVAGMKADSIDNLWTSIYLPSDLMQALESTRLEAIGGIGSSDTLGSKKTLVTKTVLGEQRILYKSSPKDNQLDWLVNWICFIMYIILFLFIFYFYPSFFPKKRFSSLLRILAWWLCYLPLGSVALIFYLSYFSEPASSFGYETMGYNFILHAFNPLMLGLVVIWPFFRNSKRHKLWYLIHSIFLCILGLGFVLSIFLAPYQTLLLGIVLCMQSMLVFQIRKNYL